MKRKIIRVVFVYLICCLVLGNFLNWPGIANAESKETINTIPQSWFDDVLFIGDSQTGALSIYNLMSGDLGKAVIYHYNGLACHHIIRENTQFFFKGKYCSLEEMILLSGAKNVFIMLVMNDICTIPLDELSNCWEELISRVRDNCPEVTLFIQSATPVTRDSWIPVKADVDEYNGMLKNVCNNNSDCCIFVDVTDGLADEEGYLKQKYSRDNIHLSPEGCAVWVDNLYNLKSYRVSSERKTTVWGVQ